MKMILTLAAFCALSSCSPSPSANNNSPENALKNHQSLMAAERANRLIDQQNYSAANSELTTAINSYPEPQTDRQKAILGTFYADRGLTHLRQGNHPQAMNDFNEAIKIAPNAPGPHAMRGMVHLKDGNPDFAKGDLQHALTLNPVPKLRTEILQILKTL